MILVLFASGVRVGTQARDGDWEELDLGWVSLRKDAYEEKEARHAMA
jgi:hypothetical protein